MKCQENQLSCTNSVATNPLANSIFQAICSARVVFQEAPGFVGLVMFHELEKGWCVYTKKTKNERMSTLKRALTIFRESSSEPNIYFCRWYIIIYFIFRELTYPLLFRHVWEDDFTVLRFGRICGLVSWRVSAKRNMNLKIEIALGCPWKLVTRE